MRRELHDPRLGMLWLALRLWVGWQLLQDAFDGGSRPVAVVEAVAGIALLAGLATLPAAAAAAALALAGLVSGGGDPLVLALSLLLVGAGPAAYVYGADRFVLARLRKIRNRPQSRDRYTPRAPSGSLSGRPN